MTVLGWDIGGSNTKVARVDGRRVVRALSRPFEVKDAPQDLPQVLRDLAAEAAGQARIDAHAVTMTAELSRAFLTKREGVASVLDAVESALSAAPIHVFMVDGTFAAPASARRDFLRAASANWMAAARMAAATWPDALFVDVGSTTTDITPIAAGAVTALGRTDPERLATGELVYSGAVRTPVEALASRVPVLGVTYGLGAERFATSGDVHVWRGDLMPGDVSGDTADGRAPDRQGAGHRLARALCADRDLMNDAMVSALAEALATAQVESIAASMRTVAARHPSIAMAVVAGLGDFIAVRAARLAELDVRLLASETGDAGARCAPAAAVALLLDGVLQPDARIPSAQRAAPLSRAFDVVVKVGGGLLARDEALARVVRVLDQASRILVVPGGGPFADAVREVYRRGAVGDDAAHWMAIRAMDQYAELLVSRLARGRLVTSVLEARLAAAAGRTPVLAPSRWLRDADPLPHSWDVTSDSLAAWVAGQTCASSLVLVKPPGATGALTDPVLRARAPIGCRVSGHRG